MGVVFFEATRFGREVLVPFLDGFGGKKKNRQAKSGLGRVSLFLSSKLFFLSGGTGFGHPLAIRNYDRAITGGFVQDP